MKQKKKNDSDSSKPLGRSSFKYQSESIMSQIVIAHKEIH